MREPKKVRTRPELVKSCRALRVHNEALKAEIHALKTGYQGACYCCESVGELNQALQKRLNELEAEVERQRAFFRYVEGLCEQARQGISIP